MTTMHPDAAALARLVHGEGSPEERRVSEEHLATCASCRRHAATMREEDIALGALLSTLDEPLPPVAVEAVLQRVSRPAVSHPWRRLAAGVLVALGIGGAAWALPGSPIRAAVRRWLESRSLPPAAEQPSTAPVQGPAPAAAMSGVAVAPGASVTVELRGPPVGRVQLTLTEAAQLTVEAPVGVGEFASATGRVVVRWSDTTATVIIGVPRSAPHVEVRGRDQALWSKVGSAISSSASALGGHYELRLPP